jgi:hypothetical protein
MRHFAAFIIQQPGKTYTYCLGKNDPVRHRLGNFVAANVMVSHSMIMVGRGIAQI